MLVLLASASAAFACSLVEEPQVTTWLGTSWNDQTSGTAPSNLASVTILGEGTPIRVGALELWRVPEGTTEVDAFGRTIVLDTTPDEVAPSTPVVRDAVLTVTDDDVGCRGFSSCGTITRLSYEVEATDDRAAREQLTFALWLRREPGAPTGTPDKLVVADRYGSSPDLWTYGDSAWEGRDLWLTVQVLDQAGNASAMSEAFLVDTGSRGCATSGTRAWSTLAPLAFGLLLLRRRRVYRSAR
ncbi:MAG: hypothetical protein H6724_05225 [Sandaracinus sp.]|nr:hypothetical protein [Sandaracinus sp.]